MPDWKTLLLGPDKAPPTAGHTVDLLEVTPHGGDLHLVTATVDGQPFRGYIPTGDLRQAPVAVQRRMIAHRVRAAHKPAPAAPSLTGREERLP